MRKSSNMLLSFNQIAPKLIPCFWPIFTDFQNEVVTSISAKYEPNRNTLWIEIVVGSLLIKNTDSNFGNQRSCFHVMLH